MTAEMNQIHPTGLFIPVDKQSLFICVFEERLFNVYKIIPIFGPTRKDKSCEVKFKYMGATRMFACDSDLAKTCVKQNLHLLGCNEEIKKKSSRSSRVTETIDLDKEMTPSKGCGIKTVDLTNVEPDVIVLDETLSQLNKTLNQLDVTCNSIKEVEVIDLATLDSSNRNINRFGNDVEIVCVKDNKKTNMSTVPNSKPTTSISRVQGNKPKHNCNSSVISVSLNRSGVRTVSSTPSKKLAKSCKRSASLANVIATSKSKNRKLQDVSNIPSNATSPTSKPLTDNATNYYNQLNKHLEKIKQEGIFISIMKNKKRQAVVNNALQSRKAKFLQQQNRNNKSPRLLKPLGQTISRTFSPNRHGVGRSGPQTINKFNIRKPLRRLNSSSNLQKTFKGQNQKFAVVNTFNPNPYDVEREGLRPVVVDGCNIAMGHGKGKFSVKGIKICVDYFASRGHNNVKVFLPVSRKANFSEELLAELNSKSEIAFTPSQHVNGVWKTSYDDRFIVQYAFEFGGVIVSTDNYRDLLKENPSWRDTIENRLLMFTWVDDFLMFPVDPLGKTGPTLDRFLRF